MTPFRRASTTVIRTRPPLLLFTVPLSTRFGFDDAVPLMKTIEKIFLIFLLLFGLFEDVSLNFDRLPVDCDFFNLNSLKHIRIMVKQLMIITQSLKYEGTGMPDLILQPAQCSRATAG